MTHKRLVPIFSTGRANAIDYSGDTDVDFTPGIIVHQDGAVAMARMGLQNGEGTEVRGWTNEVVGRQEADMLRRRVWRARQPAAPVTAAP